MESSIVGAMVHTTVGVVPITDESHGSIANESLRTLTGEADASPDRDNLCEAQNAAMRESPTIPVVEGDMELKTRRCLICQSPFPSAWVGERICRRCKSTATWRSGVGRK